MRSAFATAGILALIAAGILAGRQRDLLDPARMDQGPPAAARLLLERQRYGPGDPIAPARLIEERGLDWAERTFREAARLTPAWAPWQYALGLVALRRGDVAGAGERFATARNLAPNYAGLAEQIGATWVSAAVARRQPELLLDAFPPLKAAARLDPPSLRRTFRLLSPLAPDPRRLASLVPDLPACRQEYGILLVDAGYPEDAVRELTAVLAGSEHPGGEAEMALGRARLALGDVDGAAGAFERGLAGVADPTARLRGLYDRYEAAGRREDGIRLWHRLEVRYPRGAKYNLGRAHFEAGPREYEAAFEEFRAVLAEERDPPTTSYLARIELAWSLFRDARTRLDRAVRKWPRDADLHYLYALALRGGGQPARARRQIAIAGEIDPSNDLFSGLLSKWETEDGIR